MNGWILPLLGLVGLLCVVLFIYSLASYARQLIWLIHDRPAAVRTGPDLRWARGERLVALQGTAIAEAVRAERHGRLVSASLR
jgi:hypothetical protein